MGLKPGNIFELRLDDVEVLYLGMGNPRISENVMYLALNVSQAAGLMENGYNVRFAQSGTRILGHIFQEDTLYFRAKVPAYRPGLHWGYYGINPRDLGMWFDGRYRWSSDVHLNAQQYTGYGKDVIILSLKKIVSPFIGEEREVTLDDLARKILTHDEYVAATKPRYSIGDVMTVEGVEYVIGDIGPRGVLNPSWRMRLDKKFSPSIDITIKDYWKD